MFVRTPKKEVRIGHIIKKEERRLAQDKDQQLAAVAASAEKNSQYTFVQLKERRRQQYYLHQKQQIKSEDYSGAHSDQFFTNNPHPSNCKSEHCHLLSSEEQITSSLMKSQKRPDDSEESENQNGIYTTIQTELSIQSRRASIYYQEIDLSAASIKKFIKVEGMEMSRHHDLSQELRYTSIQPQDISPIYSYKNYVDTFLPPKSENLVQPYEARVRSLSNPSNLYESNSALIPLLSRRFSLPSPSNESPLNQPYLSFLQSLSFKVEKCSLLIGDVCTYMKNYPIYHILSSKDKKSKKLAGKIIQQSGGISIGSLPIAIREDNQLEQYQQYSSHQQTMLNYINIDSIILNMNPSRGFCNLIEAQFYYFIIGDYKKLKRIQDRFSSDDDDLNNKSYPFSLDQNIYNTFAETDSSSLQSADSTSSDQSVRKYNIDEFIAFKSQTTTSKITKMQKSTFNNPFQDFSTHQREKYNPNRNQFYNLPKYCMVFILELLSSKNLRRLGVSPEYQLLIQKIAKNIKNSAQIKEQKKKIMYNHNHYNCLFLTLNQQNTTEVQNSQDLKKLHLSVYGIDNLIQPFDNLYINILKKVIERVIMIQLQLIQEFPLTQYIINNKDLYQFEKSKINYIERVIQGISKLREGEIIKRF